MLHQPTIEKLLAMHLEPMVETWRNLEQNQDTAELSFEDKLSLMVDRLWTWRARTWRWNGDCVTPS